MTANTYFPRKTMMSVEMLELIKGLLCVGKCDEEHLVMVKGTWLDNEAVVA